MNFKDPKIHFKVDIGLPQPLKDKKKETAKRIEYLKNIKCNAELEKLARDNECKYLWYIIIYQ
jgi:large subunit ribosomal protein L38